MSMMGLGAVLAFAVTFTTRQLDVQTAGLVLLCVGALDFLLSLSMALYERGAFSRRVVTHQRWDPRQPVAPADEYPGSYPDHDPGRYPGRHPDQHPTLRLDQPPRQ